MEFSKTMSNSALNPKLNKVSVRPTKWVGDVDEGEGSGWGGLIALKVFLGYVETILRQTIAT